MKAKSVTALIVGAITLLNLFLTGIGLSPLPQDAEGIGAGVSAVLALASGAVATWYNFSVTEPAKAADAALSKVRSGELTAQQLIEAVDAIVEAGSDLTRSFKGEGTD